MDSSEDERHQQELIDQIMSVPMNSSDNSQKNLSKSGTLEGAYDDEDLDTNIIVEEDEPHHSMMPSKYGTAADPEEVNTGNPGI